MKISDPDNNNSTIESLPFLEFAFRPFFLLGALFSIISLVIWNGVLNGNITIDLYGGSLWWHMHEMLFGFAAAIIVGFLLTAVQNWSGIRGINGHALLGLVSVWVSARIAFFFPEQIPTILIAAIDLTFLPLSAVALAYPIVKAQLWKNLLFIPILLVMAISNALTHYSVSSNDYLLLSKASTFMVLLVTLIMCIMGGRVFPMFTANGTQTTRVNAIPVIERLSIMTILAAVIVGADFIAIPSSVVATIFFSASAIHAFRVFRWRIWVTFKTPLVWSLHLSYWCIVIGLFMFGLSEVTTNVSHSQAIHTITIGGMASMILSMISRVSLGHTGRIIMVGKTMFIAFIAIILAFIVRVFGIYLFTDYTLILTLTVTFWAIGFGCFVIRYLSILIRPSMKR